MDGSDSSDSSDSFDWGIHDEPETQSAPISTRPSIEPSATEMIGQVQKESSSDPARAKLISHFVGMGFSGDMVIKAVDENGGNMEMILETLLTLSALKDDICLNSKPMSPSSSETSEDDENDSDFESTLCNEDQDEYCGTENKFLLLVDMGFPEDEATSAIDRCGNDASVLELADSIYAAQMSKTTPGSHAKELHRMSSDDEDYELGTSCSYNEYFRKQKKMKLSKEEKPWANKTQIWSKKKQIDKNILLDEDDPSMSFGLPKPMIGFGVPDEPIRNMVHRKLPESAIGPPYFYYENVALAPKGVWETMSRFLYDIKPEFVDSKYFCAAARKRGYIHNLPIHNRFTLLPIPPRTIHEALPSTKKWWPSWDPRTHLNCLQTVTASARLTDRIRQALTPYDDPPPLRVQQYVLNECRKWNLVWVGVHKVAPLEPDEVEMLLGFPKNHTRGGGISRTERLKSLGNSFQIDTVAYHLSVLKSIFPNGMNVLSLFSGIGGAEVALHRLGIPLKNVVSIEISEVNRNILRSWWEQTEQKGNLIDIADIQHLTGSKLEHFVNAFGGFDLIVGGSPCNNLAGSNRVSRDGLEGKQSSLFYDYFRILDLVKCIMEKR